jgi:hypothetical protein
VNATGAQPISRHPGHPRHTPALLTIQAVCHGHHSQRCRAPSDRPTIRREVTQNGPPDRLTIRRLFATATNPSAPLHHATFQTASNVAVPERTRTANRARRTANVHPVNRSRPLPTRTCRMVAYPQVRPPRGDHPVPPPGGRGTWPKQRIPVAAMRELSGWAGAANRHVGAANPAGCGPALLLRSALPGLSATLAAFWRLRGWLCLAAGLIGSAGTPLSGCPARWRRPRQAGCCALPAGFHLWRRRMDGDTTALTDREAGT